MADIFLSYAREDSNRARLLAEKLESHGWSVWWDRRIPHGKDFTVFIQQQLDDARCIVVLWSKASLASPFVRDEAGEGLNGRLVPLLLEQVKPPLGFRQLQAADLSDWTGESSHDEFALLIESVAAIVPARTAPTPTTQAEVEQEASGPVSCDVYISYSHFDDLPLVEGSQGWVASFGRALQIRLSQLLGREPHIWINSKRDGVRTDVDVEALRQAAAFVAVVSPRYIRSESAAGELWEFLKVRSGIQAQDNGSVFKVLKTPIPLDKTPDPLKSLVGYEFFLVDTDTGKVREFDQIFGPEAQQHFWFRLDDLAHDVATSVEKLRPSTI